MPLILVHVNSRRPCTPRTAAPAQPLAGDLVNRTNTHVKDATSVSFTASPPVGTGAGTGAGAKRAVNRISRGLAYNTYSTAAVATDGADPRRRRASDAHRSVFLEDRKRIRRTLI